MSTDSAGPRAVEAVRARHVTAVLGPTNTGKTHLAIERMLGHETGLIGLPLRLLAREVYDKIVGRAGAEHVALITGEEKIKPERPRYWVCTVEAMPRDLDVDFVAIDEIQLAADPERGHVFTDRLFHARGKAETLLLGAQTMGGAINDLIPGANFITRPRLSKLTYSGQKKITRLPERSAVVAFSAADVYEVAELIRRQRGGAAVVLGALSPRTRNAQVALYQSGDVAYIVATDAIGMGLNLDVDHVAFAGVRKFDGQHHRDLTPAELGQIAGRAGRHMNDGTFGVTGSAEPFAQDLVDRLESHTFDSVKVLQWRNRVLDFHSLERLMASLRETPASPRLMRARAADDLDALEAAARDDDVRRFAAAPAAIARLWDICQVPDYRKISPQSHAELVVQLYKFLMSPEERIPEDWFAAQVKLADRTDGDIDTLATRIAHIRTWTFVSNRTDWLKDPEHWQGRTREIEDALSDALHEQLTQRFVDKRTSALMKGLRDKEELNADIKDDGAIHVENHYVGRLKGFRFEPETQGDSSVHGKATRHAAAQVLAKELAMRARRVAAAKGDAFKLSRRGRILWKDEEIARLEPGDNPMKPQVVALVDEHISGPDREKVQKRCDEWIAGIIEERLKPLVEIAKAEDITGLAKGIAFRLTESFGVLKRDVVADEIRTLDQAARSQLRKYGVRFGAFNIFFPGLLKPATTDLILVLWGLKGAAASGLSLETMPEPPRPGLTSVKADAAIPEAFYRTLGFHLCGPRAVRVDMLERLADQIRPLIAWRPNAANPVPAPRGATGDGAFKTTPEMMSIMGCPAEELAAILKALGFRLERRKPRPIPVPAPAPAATPALQAPATAETTANEEELAESSSEPGDGVAGEAAAPEALATGSPTEAAVAAIETPTPPPAEPPSVPVTTETPVTASQPMQAGAASMPAQVEAETPPAAPSEATTLLATPAPATAETPAAPAEPELEEVWRPRRHRHEGERRHQRGPRRHGQAQGKGRPQQGDSTAAPAAAAADPAATPPTGERDRDRDRHRGPRRDRDKDQKWRGRERGAEGGQGGGKGRDDRRHGGPRHEPRVNSAAPPKKKGVDPDNPFAALGALKKELEKRTRGGT